MVAITTFSSARFFSDEIKKINSKLWNSLGVFYFLMFVAHFFLWILNETTKYGSAVKTKVSFGEK